MDANLPQRRNFIRLCPFRRERIASRPMKVAGAISVLLSIPAALSPSPVRTSAVVFTDITSSAGIFWKQVSGASVCLSCLRLMGGGVGFLDLNKHDGTFEDKALDADMAFNMDGEALSGMGVDAADS
jgi:hypothetical protein